MTTLVASLAPLQEMPKLNIDNPCGTTGTTAGATSPGGRPSAPACGGRPPCSCPGAAAAVQAAGGGGGAGGRGHGHERAELEGDCAGGAAAGAHGV